MNRFFYFTVLLLAICTVFFACSKEMPKPAYPRKSEKIILPDKQPVQLNAIGRIVFSPINETSGLVRSRLWPDVLWTHNDSGDEARIFPISMDGSILKPEWMKKYQGIQIPNAVNVDWEDITTDDVGNLIIADVGNNTNARRDLTIYFVAEPYPIETVITSTQYSVHVYYPEQKEFPAIKRNFDCEGVFWANGKLYFVTKHRSDKYTSLYRLDTLDPVKKVALTYIGQFDIGGMVTGADATPDGKEIAVLTYSAMWLFEAPEGSDDYFNGKIRWLPIAQNRKYEAICYHGDTLLIACEERDIFEVKKDAFVVVRE
ncbi:MAG: hypothetical protein ACE5I1_00270 [bacterium]